MKISVITVNKDNSEGLRNTISSVKLQNRNIVEYIIVDGASTDDSLSVINRNKSFIDYIISEPDLGIYDAMNKGISVATGDYLIFLNSGDLFYNSNVLDCFVKNNYIQDFVLGDVCFIYGSMHYESHLPKKMHFFDFLEGVCHQGTFIKHDAFLKIGKYNVKYKIIADWALLFEAVLLKKCSYTIHSKCIACYCLDGLSSKTSSKAYVEKEKKAFLCENDIKYNTFLFYLYRFSYRILKIRFFYIISQFKFNENTTDK